MTDKSKYILQLLDKFQKGTASPQELQELDDWYQSNQAEPLYTSTLSPEQKDQQRLKLLNRIDQEIDDAIVPSKKPLWPVMLSSAAVLFMVFGLAVYFLKGHNVKDDAQSATDLVEIGPGGNKAVLTLADGKKIVLENTPEGNLANEGDTKIIKLDSGMLAYQADGHTNTSVQLLNTISTPVGGQFKVILSDGTMVWLNASSTITFPTQFNDSERTVSTTGETYFEVAKAMRTDNKGLKKRIPFKIKTGVQEIEVLGTHFNINAYANETAIRTTLLEGSIGLSNKKIGNRRVLIPGQQAVVPLDNQEISVNQVDTEKAIAWKSGFFRFDNTDLYTLMRELERWYGIDVVYQSSIKSDSFYGKIERSYTLNEVLKVLELGNVHFKIDGKINANGRRTLLVLP